MNEHDKMVWSFINFTRVTDDKHRKKWWIQRSGHSSVTTALSNSELPVFQFKQYFNSFIKFMSFDIFNKERWQHYIPSLIKSIPRIDNWVEKMIGMGYKYFTGICFNFDHYSNGKTIIIYGIYERKLPSIFDFSLIKMSRLFIFYA